MSQKKKKISDQISEAIFHFFFFPFFYVGYRIRGNSHELSMDRYKAMFSKLSEFLVFIIIFLSISFLAVVWDILRH